MKMFQYWHDAEPPADVAAWIAGFRDGNPGLEHRRSDFETGRDWLARHYGSDVAAAFASCAVPAMQADFLRVFLIDRYGGFYLDADHEPAEPLDTMIAGVDRAVLLIWLGALNNDLLIFRAPGHPFVRAVRDVLLDNVVHRRFDTVPLATGPAVLNAVYWHLTPGGNAFLDQVVAQSPWVGWGWADLIARTASVVRVDDALREAFAEITLHPLDWKFGWMGRRGPRYKEEDGGIWWQRRDSIYR